LSLFLITWQICFRAAMLSCDSMNAVRLMASTHNRTIRSVTTEVR